MESPAKDLLTREEQKARGRYDVNAIAAKLKEQDRQLRAECDDQIAQREGREKTEKSIPPGLGKKLGHPN